MATKKIFPLAVLAVAVGAFAYAMRSAPVEEKPAAPPAEKAEPEKRGQETPAATPEAEKPEPPSQEEKNEAAARDDEAGKVKLARERAEEERLNAAKKAEEPPPEPREKRFFRVKVQDAATIESGDRTIRLAGVAPRDPTDRCTARDGRSWPCGAVARAALMRLIRGRAVDCEMPKAGAEEQGAHCKIGGTDLSRWVLENGWAEPEAGVEAKLKDAHAEAKEKGLGLYRHKAPQVSLTP